MVWFSLVAQYSFLSSQQFYRTHCVQTHTRTFTQWHRAKSLNCSCNNISDDVFLLYLSYVLYICNVCIFVCVCLSVYSTCRTCRYCICNSLLTVRTVYYCSSGGATLELLMSWYQYIVYVLCTSHYPSTVPQNIMLFTF